MAKFKDLDQYLDDQLELTVKGKTYTFSPADARLGLRMQRMLAVGMGAAHGNVDEDAATEAMAGMEDETFFPQIMGDTYEQLLADGVPYRALTLISSTLMLWNLQGEDEAAEFWQSGGKAPAPNRAQRRAATTRTGAASTTKRRASGTGTSTRPRKSGTATKAAG